jgi:hypothetical protein
MTSTTTPTPSETALAVLVAYGASPVTTRAIKSWAQYGCSYTDRFDFTAMTITRTFFQDERPLEISRLVGKITGVVPSGAGDGVYVKLTWLTAIDHDGFADQYDPRKADNKTAIYLTVVTSALAHAVTSWHVSPYA